MKFTYNPYYLACLSMFCSSKSLSEEEQEKIASIKKDIIETLRIDPNNSYYVGMMSQLNERITGNEKKSIARDQLFKDFLFIKNKEDLSRLYPQLIPIFEIILSNPNFEHFEKENIQYLEEIKDAWTDTNVMPYLKHITGVECNLDGLEITVVPPYFEKSFCFNNQISIASRINQNRIITLITHEILHHVLPSLEDEYENDIRHAIIELLADNEMNRFLYNDEYGDNIGNIELSEIINVIKPNFIEYLNMRHNSTDVDIIDFENEAKEILNVNKIKM